MTVTLELSTELDGRLERAKARGYSVELLLRNALDRVEIEILTTETVAKPPTDGHDKAEAFLRWASSFPKGTGYLSDEALTRESIYGTRG